MLYNGQYIQHGKACSLPRAINAMTSLGMNSGHPWLKACQLCQLCQLKRKYRYQNLRLKEFVHRVGTTPYFWDILAQCLTLRVSMICDKNSRLSMRSYYVLSSKFLFILFSLETKTSQHTKYTCIDIDHILKFAGAIRRQSRHRYFHPLGYHSPFLYVVNSVWIIA